MQTNKKKSKSSNIFHTIERNSISVQKSFDFTNSVSPQLIKKIRLIDILGFSKSSQNTSSRTRNATSFGGISESGVGCLFCLKLSEDGTRIASSVGETVNIYSTQTGQLLKSLSSHTEIVTAFTWMHSPNSTLNSFPSQTTNSNKEELLEDSFVTASLDKTIKWWKNNQVAATLKDHKDWIRCLSVNKDNRYMISGCVSSVIMGWDMFCDGGPKVVFKIPNAHQSPACPELNTINSLYFSNTNESLFLSGARDGSVKVWDMRERMSIYGNSNNNSNSYSNGKSISTIQAHIGKLNASLFSMEDRYFLSSGRDNTIRMWDTRLFSSQSSSSSSNSNSKSSFISNDSSKSKISTKGLVKEFNEHKCNGYNVNCCWFSNDKYIVTGSEDKKVYIYNTLSGKVDKVLEHHPSVVHLVSASERSPEVIVSSSIENTAILVWSPKEESDKRSEVAEKKLKEVALEDGVLEQHRTVVESIMKKHGDQILKLFHRYNFTFSSPIDWQTIMQDMNQNNGSDSVMDMVNEITSDFARAFETESEEEEEEEEEED